VQEIAESAFEEQRRFEAGDLIQVGVNAFVASTEEPLEILEIPMATEESQRVAVARTRSERDSSEVDAALAALAAAAADPEADLMEPLIVCARARCTEGEVTVALQSVFGPWRETPRF
jgi:methylmalonyl-CoA mutase N-terminal domain/subunit